MWNTFFGDVTSWKRKRDIVDEAAAACGRDSGDIESCVTVEGALPETDQDSEQWLERLGALTDLGISYFVLDFGHPLDPEPASRFAEQVMAPMKQP